MGRGKNLTHEARQVVVEGVLADRARGMSVRAVALKYHISEGSVYSYQRAARMAEGGPKILGDTSAKPGTVEAIVDDYRPVLEAMAVRAVKNGLDCPADPYRQGTLGVQTLKGLGRFSPDNAPAGALAALALSVPASLAHEFAGILGDSSNTPPSCSSPVAVEEEEQG